MMQIENFEIKTPVVKIDHDIVQKSEVSLYLKREDLIHPQLSGNKWRKLKYNLLKARQESKTTLLTFGGAFSNHIAAVAAAGTLFNFKTIGIIRGESVKPLNHTLRNAKRHGMELVFVNRTDYRDRESLNSTFLKKYPEAYLIPEGGTNHLALKGCREIISDLDFEDSVDFWCTACGTGGTAAGMIQALKKGQNLIGFSVLKGDFMEDAIKDLLDDSDASNNWSVNNAYHFGGYAKFNSTLIDFINDFKNEFDIPLDPVYTGKLLYGVLDLIGKRFFPKGANVMAVHTGGLQGIEGFNERFGGIIQ